VPGPRPRESAGRCRRRRDRDARVAAARISRAPSSAC